MGCDGVFYALHDDYCGCGVVYGVEGAEADKVVETAGAGSVLGGTEDYGL